MGCHYVDFIFAFDTTLILLEMTEIWPKYVAHESSVQDPPWIGLKQKYQKFLNVAQNLSRYFWKSKLPSCLESFILDCFIGHNSNDSQKS